MFVIEVVVFLAADSLKPLVVEVVEIIAMAHVVLHPHQFSLWTGLLLFEVVFQFPVVVFIGAMSVDVEVLIVFAATIWVWLPARAADVPQAFAVRTDFVNRVNSAAVASRTLTIVEHHFRHHLPKNAPAASSRPLEKPRAPTRTRVSMRLRALVKHIGLLLRLSFPALLAPKTFDTRFAMLTQPRPVRIVQPRITVELPDKCLDGADSSSLVNQLFDPYSFAF